VTVYSSEKPVAGMAETGWAKARRRWGKGLRTCLPAIVERGGPREALQDQDGNIVRGED
jgi:hypothetical protein